MTDKIEKPTIHDVAREAGVAISTVSRVMNGLDRVSPATRKKVKEAIAKLNFYPNSRAQALGSKRTGMIGLVIPNFTGDYFTRLMEGATSQAKEYGVNIMVIKATSPSEKIDVLTRLREEERVDGAIVIIGEVESKVLDIIGGNFKNLVVLNKDVEHRRLDNIFVDNLTAGFEATTHMVKVNRFEKMIFIGGPENSVDTIQRGQGFANALASNNMEDQGRVFHAEHYLYDDGYSLAKKEIVSLIKGYGRTGIVAANDQIACGVIDALIESKLKVPDDAGVIGFDDSILAIRRNLKLSTMRIPVDEMGMAAVKMVMNRLSEDSIRSGPGKLILRAELIVRQSCGCGQKV